MIPHSYLSCAASVLDGWNRMEDTASSARWVYSGAALLPFLFLWHQSRWRSLSHHTRFLDFCLLRMKGNRLVSDSVTWTGDQLAVLPLSRAISVPDEISW